MSKPINNNSNTQTRALTANELDAELIEQWSLLVSDSEPANPFLSPEFILPFLENPGRQREPIFLVCENKQDRKLVGLGIFEHVRASRLLPLPHLIPFQCEHAFRRGFLIAKNSIPDFIDSLLSYMCNHQKRWFGIEFSEFPLEQKWSEELGRRVKDFGCSFQLQSRFDSPSVNLTDLEEDGLAGQWSSSRRKTMRRNLNRLKKHGEVNFRIMKQGQELPDALERFLVLEHTGWKKERGTSILSCDDDQQFVRKMVSRMASQNRVLISELQVGRDVAASSINFVTDCEMFAFKIGYNEKYAEASPGLLHEVQLVDCLRESYPHITRIDGCARPNSYLDKLWPDRIPIAEGLLSVSTFAQAVGGIMSQVRSAKQWAYGFSHE
ncbi:MAG: GNAT family N-acetyltransferase [Planctomycetaceae bacterium]|nr:GNAT family N-acetyltransferase [Planctomycetaceae bacterium]